MADTYTHTYAIYLHVVISRTPETLLTQLLILLLEIWKKESKQRKTTSSTLVARQFLEILPQK